MRRGTGGSPWGGVCDARPRTCWSSSRRGMNMSPSLWLCAVLATCSGFNIDERFPVVKEGKTKGSFFGFSVALHQQTEGSSKYL